jgi:heme exporter protein CcmD
MGGMGVIEGGWEFVWAAYGVFTLVLAGYALSIYARYRAERRRREREIRAGAAGDVSAWSTKG